MHPRSITPDFANLVAAVTFRLAQLPIQHLLPYCAERRRLASVLTRLYLGRRGADVCLPHILGRLNRRHKLQDDICDTHDADDGTSNVGYDVAVV